MSVRKPRAWLQLDAGASVNVIHAEVTQTRYMLADTFIVKMALDDPTNPGAAFWEDTPIIQAEVVANNGDGSSGLQVLISGAIDVVEIDWDERIVTVHGTDKVGEMLDTRSDEHWPNMNAGAIASMIASKHGLVPHVDDDKIMAGKTYDLQNFAFNSSYENEWDVIQSLAKQEGKIAYVVGNHFYFTTPTPGGSNSSGDYTVIYKAPPQPSLLGGAYGYMSLRTWRNLAMENFTTLSASWHPFEKKANTSKADAPDSSIQDNIGASDIGGGFV